MSNARLKWVKTGGYGTSTIVYTADAGGFTIIRPRICGEWTKPALYLNDRFLAGFQTVAQAKGHAEKLHVVTCQTR